MALGGGATRNAVPLYDVGAPFIRLHLVQRGAGAHLGAARAGGDAERVRHRELLDELARGAGADPVAYRLALLPDPRAGAVIERAAAMAGWAARGPAGSGRGLGPRLRALQEPQRLCRRRRRRGGGPRRAAASAIWCAADCGCVINPDGARNQLEGGIVHGGEHGR